MALVARARAMIVAPAREWPLVALERTPPGLLFSSYIVPLAALPAVCSLISGIAFFHRGILFGAVFAVMNFVLALVGVAVIALIAEALAPSFDGVKDREQAFKWIGYAYTPSWVAGIALLVPILGALVVLVAGFYSLYVLYLGAQPMMGVPSHKTIGYTAVVIVIAIVVYAAVAGITALVVGALAAGAIAAGGGLH